MGIKNWKNTNGKERLYLSKVWPDGSRYRRVMPNKTAAKKTLSRINESIAMGTWRQLKHELNNPTPEKSDPTIAEFAATYRDEYCAVKNRRPDFKDNHLPFITESIGKVKVSEMTRAHAYQLIGDRRKGGVSSATINRSLAVLKNLLSFAVEKEILDMNPLRGFKLLPEPQTALRIMTLQEERKLVECVALVDPVIGAYVALLGETGLRKSEALKLRWSHVDLHNRTVTVEMGASKKGTKSGKVRIVPLSGFAIEWLRSLARIVGIPEVFLQAGTTRPWRVPRGPFEVGRENAGLDWVTFHDLRHFRATQWVRMGVDLRTVQELLGHSSITVTQRYAHFAQSHAQDEVLRVAMLEAEISAQVAHSGHMVRK